MTILVGSLAEVKSWKGEPPPEGVPIPAGEHDTVIDAIEEGVTANGNPQIIVTWRTLAGNATSREWLVIMPETYGKAKAFLEAIGYAIPSGDFSFPILPLVGRKARTVWRTETYNGKTRTKCVAHSPIDETVPQPMGAPVASHDDLPF